MVQAILGVHQQQGVGMGRPKNTPERFWSLVDKQGEDDCWLWKGNRTTGGYGTFILHGMHTTVHRLSYWLATGEYPTGLVVCHRCDVQLCVNPKHLFLGTQADNIRDMNEKGRARFGILHGSDHGRAKLSDQDVREIREMYGTGRFPQRELADLFEISQVQISRIVRMESRSSA